MKPDVDWIAIALILAICGLSAALMIRGMYLDTKLHNQSETVHTESP